MILDILTGLCLLAFTWMSGWALYEEWRDGWRRRQFAVGVLWNIVTASTTVWFLADRLL